MKLPLTPFLLFLTTTSFLFADTPEETTTPLPTPTASTQWVPAPAPSEAARNLSFQVDSFFTSDLNGSRLASFGEIAAKRKLDEYSTTADLQVRFTKDLSNSDSVQSIDLRLARLTLIEPFFQFSLGRFDLFPVLTPMSFFGSYPTMGLHRVDGAMVVLPIFFKFGIENYQTYTAPPTAITLFYSPSLLSAENVVLDTQQAFLLTQARFKTNIAGFESSFRANFAFTGTDYFQYSSLNGGLSYSFAADFVYDKDYTVYGELGVQNAAYFSDTSVLGFGGKWSRIGTWGPFSIDSLNLEAQLPIENSLNNPFSGGNGFNPSQAFAPQMTWYGDLKGRIQNIFLTFAVTNNLDDFTFGRLNSGNTSFPNASTIGPGRETDKDGILLKTASSNQPAFLISAGIDF